MKGSEDTFSMKNVESQDNCSDKMRAEALRINASASCGPIGTLFKHIFEGL